MVRNFVFFFRVVLRVLIRVLPNKYIPQLPCQLKELCISFIVWFVWLNMHNSKATFCYRIQKTTAWQSFVHKRLFLCYALFFSMMMMVNVIQKGPLKNVFKKKKQLTSTILNLNEWALKQLCFKILSLTLLSSFHFSGCFGGFYVNGSNGNKIWKINFQVCKSRAWFRGLMTPRTCESY